MTTIELDGFRRHVQQQLAAAEEELGQPIMYTFSGAADAAAEGALLLLHCLASAQSDCCLAHAGVVLSGRDSCFA